MHKISLYTIPYRPLAVGVLVGMINHAAAILEYNVWVLSMGHKFGEGVHSVNDSIILC